MIEPIISSCSFYEKQGNINNNTFHKFIMEGRNKEYYTREFKELQDWKGMLYQTPSLTYIQVIDFGSLIGDSAKLR